MSLKALIFDVDGTLAETEEIHRKAFNQAFMDAGLDWRWSRQRYRELLAISGGKERIRHFMAEDDLAQANRTDLDEWIAKPVTGGEHTVVIADVRHEDSWRRRLSDAPGFIQQRLEAPDLRIYRIGDKWFPFTLVGDTIDYRASGNLTIQPAATALDLVKALALLMNHLGLDFGAADFKRCPESGRYLFLEVNSAPMFSTFDQVLSGALADAIIEWLAGNRAPAVSPEP